MASETPSTQQQTDDDFEDFAAPDDSSDDDPTFDILEETRSRLSKISIKKSKPKKVKEIEIDSMSDGEEGFGVVIEELDEKDVKCFENVEKMIKDGQLQKLKVDQCKVYLRKYGLRLTGNKSILLERIKEHLEVINGGGEKKYPASSFVMNCKGDACTGDVVMFEQNVYEMFSIASRSATGPPCGTRTVAGRIVKESYGAAKQQHTFTVEVLWSKGEKALPPLHPLLIKGRNLYRLQTMRQKWADEGERMKVLREKHERGCVARCSREVRIQKKEMRKMGTSQRIPENKGGMQPHRETLQANIVRQENVHIPHQPQHHQNSPPHVQNHSAQHNPQMLKPMNNEVKTQPLIARNPNLIQVPRTYQHNIPHQYRNHNHVNQHQPHHHSSGAHNFHHIRNQQRQQQFGPPRQWCRFYRQGRCNYGDNCKYLHC